MNKRRRRWKNNYHRVTASSIRNESQVFSDEERKTLDRLVHEDLIKYKKTPTSAGLQILFMLQTGLRIGECCGLKWSDVRNGRLYVTRQANNSRVLEKTKSASGTRDIPLTKKALEILEEVKEFNEAQGFIDHLAILFLRKKVQGGASYSH